MVLSVWRHRWHGCLVVSACLLGLIPQAGCTNANVPLNGSDVRLEDRRQNHTRAQTVAHRTPAEQDGYFVGLALSGGGSRSANFSAAFMFQLERLGILQKVDYLSSVSGGSLTAAYYCLNGPDWNPAAVQKKLTHSFATDLIVQTLLLPWNWVTLTFTDYDRADLLAGIFNNVLYSRNGRTLTYADLRPDRPRLLINATDLQSGRRFVFDDESFDELNSDLSKYPIAYAVTASSAVPVVLHPVTLRDYSTTYPAYRHLIDGGLADNLGVVTLIDTYAAQLAAAQRDHRPDPYPNGAIFIVVDAHTEFNARLSSMSDVGLVDSLMSAFRLATSSLLNRVSIATMADMIVRSSPDDATAQQIREEIRAINQDGFTQMRDRTGHEVKVIYFSLSQLNQLQNMPFQGFSHSLNSISTYFNISQPEAYDLYTAADLLVKQKFEQRLRGIAGELERAAAERRKTIAR